MGDKISVFIGSGEHSILERKTLMYSIRKHTSASVDLHVFNGTHDTLESEGAEPKRLNLPLVVKYANVTEFSNYRFLIPELCNFSGKALWLDSDIVCLGDLSELWTTPLDGATFLAKPLVEDKSRWALSVMLIDCVQARFQLEEYYRAINEGQFTYKDLHEMAENFRDHYKITIKPLEERWNTFDKRQEDTKLLHFTDLKRQPWKNYFHPYGNVWFTYFREAMESGFITKQDIELSILRGVARKDVRGGNTPSPGTVKNLARSIAHYALHRWAY